MENIPNKQVCSKCSRVKDVIEFYKNRTKKFGLSQECKECTLKRPTIQNCTCGKSVTNINRHLKSKLHGRLLLLKY